jgi:prepilin-type N-terminal cleavage/methylation domain-containing protein/prepilin-type processing-associated H-X9-DG protein
MIFPTEVTTMNTQAMSDRPRHLPAKAFTLVELLVVIAIIGVLIALLLPAIQAARESGRLAACKNNLKQFGVGMHNYETSFKVLPPGYRYAYAPAGNTLGYSWGALLLPFVEEKAVYDQMRSDLPIYDPANSIPREQHLPVFLCPTDSVSPSGFVTMGTEQYAMACYVANFGPPDLDADQEQRDGVFSRNSRTRLADITDGLSKTLMLGERQNGPFRTGASHGNHFEYETTWAGAVRDLDDATDDHGHMVLFQSGHTPNNRASDDRDVSAAHGGLAQFLMCDGSVRPIQETIDPTAYAALSTRSGGEPLQE